MLMCILKILSKSIRKRNGCCFHSEYKIQGLTNKNNFSGSYVLFLICLTKVIGIDFKYSVLNLHYQMI